MSIVLTLLLRGAIAAFLIVSLITTTSLAGAETELEQEVTRVRNANNSILNVVNARLELEQHYLEQIRLLRQTGDASWLELARQQVVVDSLTSQREALIRFDTFVLELDHRLDRLTTADNASSRNVLKLYSADSERLVGWVEQDFVKLKSSKSSKPIARPSPVESDDQMLRIAEKQLKCANAFNKFAGDSSIPPQWKHQAKLQENLALAELEFLQNKKQIEGDSAVPEKRVEIVRFRIEAGTFTTADNENELQRLTYQVACLEAAAQGPLKIADLELRRHKHRIEALQKLETAALGNKRQLENTRELAGAAATRLELERARLVRLKERCAKMNSAREPNGFDVATGVETDLQLDSHEAWPEEIFVDIGRIRHLLDLRRSYHNLTGQLGAINGKLKMRRAYFDKLNKIIASFEKARFNAVNSNSKLRNSFAAGQKNERRAVQLEGEHLEAQIQSINERLTALVLEEKRFIALCLHQDRMANHSYVKLTEQNERSGINEKGAKNNQCYSFIETAELDPLAVVAMATRPAYFDFTLAQRSGSPLIHSNRYPVSLRSSYHRSTSGFAGTNIRRTSKFDLSRKSSSLEVRGNRHSTYSTQAIYPNGILRADLRSRQPVGYVPWYLPGSPTNVR